MRQFITKAGKTLAPRSDCCQAFRQLVRLMKSEILQNAEKQEIGVDRQSAEKIWGPLSQDLFEGKIRRTACLKRFSRSRAQ